MDKPVAHAIVCGQNHMTRVEMLKELKQDGVVPFLVMRMKDGRTVMPLFLTMGVMVNFVKRNLPKDWKCGDTEITEDNAKWMDEKGIVPEILTYPKRFSDIATFDVEVFEFGEGVQVETGTRQ